MHKCFMKIVIQLETTCHWSQERQPLPSHFNTPMHRLIIQDLCSLSIDALCHAKALSRLAYHVSRM